jgi:hypothetical protein
MQVFRDTFGAISPSPIRQLYGNLGGTLIAPIDIILFRGGTFSPPTSSGSFKGAEVLTSSGTVLGKISSSPWPPVDPTNVEPFVKIAPDSSLDLSGFASVISTPIPILRQDAAVELVRDGGSNISGKILDPSIQGRTYINFSFQVNSFIVRFDRILLRDLHGSKIVMSSSGQLIGMLIATQNNSDGTCDTLIFPADLVN